MIKCVHIFFSPIQHETRLFKEVKSIIKLGLVDDVTIIGYRLYDQEKILSLDNKSRIIRLNFPVKYYKYRFQVFKKIIALYSHIYFSILLLIQTMKIRPDFISCHNLFLLPICSLIKKITGAKLIYVPHELETEKTGLKKIQKTLFKWLEPTFIKGVDKTVVVCDPIKKWYFDRYKLKEIYVVRNMPENPCILNKSNVLRRSLGIDQKDIVFIYQGVIDTTRGVKELIEVFKQVKPNRHIVFMGYGDYVNDLIKLTDELTNIHYHPAVKTDEIIKYSSGADYGIFYLPGHISLSYRYSLPNKFFEYILAGLPVIVNQNLEYLSKLVSENQLGYIVDNRKQSLVELIDSLDKKTTSEFENIRNWQKNIGWHNEEKNYIKVYQ